MRCIRQIEIRVIRREIKVGEVCDRASEITEADRGSRATAGQPEDDKKHERPEKASAAHDHHLIATIVHNRLASVNASRGKGAVVVRSLLY